MYGILFYSLNGYIEDAQGNLESVRGPRFEGGLSRREHLWSLLSWEGSSMTSLPLSVLGSGPVELWAAREGCSKDFPGLEVARQ